MGIKVSMIGITASWKNHDGLFNNSEDRQGARWIELIYQLTPNNSNAASYVKV